MWERCIPVGEMYPCGRFLFPGKMKNGTLEKYENWKFEKWNV